MQDLHLCNVDSQHELHETLSTANGYQHYAIYNTKFSEGM
jgi:hypothetical protein